MASEKLQMNHGGVPSSGEASGSGRNRFEAFSLSGQRVNTERSQLTCLVVEDDQTVLRRREAGQAAVQRDQEKGRCRFGGWQLDRRNRRLTDPSGIPVALTKGEYALLTAFLDAPQRPLSREHLLQATRIHEDIFDRSIDVQVLRLRRKLETDPNAPSVILTERGVGYVFALPVEAL